MCIRDSYCKCVIGFQDYDKELLDELLKTNKYPKFICASNYVATLKGLEKEKVTCLLTGLNTDITGMKLEFNLNGAINKIDTNLMMSYNALNILTAVTTLEALNVFDVRKFEQTLNNIVIPGRAEAVSYTHLDKTKCVECGKCSEVCPYGAIAVSYTHLSWCTERYYWLD